MNFIFGQIDDFYSTQWLFTNVSQSSCEILLNVHQSDIEKMSDESLIKIATDYIE